MRLPNINKINNPEMKMINDWDWGHPPYEGQQADQYNLTGWIGKFNLDKVLSHAIAEKASDVHLAADLPITFSINGDIVKQDLGEFDDTIMSFVVANILTQEAQANFNKSLDFDGAYKLKWGPFAGRRMRVNVGLSFGKYFLVFRVISDFIPTTTELEIQDEISQWFKLPRGLILVCGATGTGKSTTLASLVNEIVKYTKKKVITIERPIEYLYDDSESSGYITQREVGEDVHSFYNGLTAAMRQAPDVILLGEVRNKEEVSEAIRGAETGHLTITTMHTNSVPTTINRIQSLFEGSEQRRIMSTLSETLVGIANQVLVKNLKGSRFAVREILTVNDEVRLLISNGDVAGIREYMKKRKSTMEHQLARAVYDEKCTFTEAKKHTQFPELVDKYVKELENNEVL